MTVLSDPKKSGLSGISEPKTKLTGLTAISEEVDEKVQIIEQLKLEMQQLKDENEVVQWYIDVMESGKDQRVILKQYLKQKSEFDAATRRSVADRKQYNDDMI